MGRPPMYIRNSLDRDVYHVVKSLVEQNGPHMSIAEIYEKIQRSNSSLKRTKKRALEDSIDRILQVFREELAESDSEAAIEEQQQRDAFYREENDTKKSADAMNQSIMKKMKKHSAANSVTTSLEQGENTPQVSKDSMKRRSRPNGLQSEDDWRPSKRKRTRDTEVVPAPSHVKLEDLGGMDVIIEKFKKSVLLPLRRPERYVRRGVKIPRGILLHGPPGCGKTMLCEAVAGELGLPWLPIQGPSIVSGMSGESEKALRQHFEAALEAAPCIIFIDEIDAITPKRESAQREMERRIVAQLLTCMDDLAIGKTDGKPVIVLAATNRPDSLDPALRRAGRFDTEINIGVPNDAVRESILRTQTRRIQLANDVDFKKLAKMTPGYVGADLESLISEADAESEERYIKALENLGADEIPPAMEMEVDKDEKPRDPSLEWSDTIRSFKRLDRILLDRNLDIAYLDTITMADFLQALPRVQPSSRREGFTTIPNTTWENVGALREIRSQLHKAIVSPILNPERYERFGLSIPAGVLLLGPPGCGKTLLAKAVANESRANFISVKGPELLNKYVGESERAVRQVFERAKSSVPCVIFFDELDALVPKRDDSLTEASSRVVNTLLTELDGIDSQKRKDIYVIAATNKPEMIDSAMLRPGRLGEHIYIGLPKDDDRAEIMRTLIKSMPVKESNIAEFARRCERFSGADLSSLASKAGQIAVERDAEFLETKDLEEAFRGMKPSVTREEMKRYEQLSGKFARVSRHPIAE